MIPSCEAGRCVPTGGSYLPWKRKRPWWNQSRFVELPHRTRLLVILLESSLIVN